MTDENVYQAPASSLDLDESEELHFAGFWIRAGATIIDTIFSLLIIFPLLILIYGEEAWLSESIVNGAWDFLITYILPAIIVIVFWVYKSATPGKMILGLEIVSLKGARKLTVWQSVGRYLAYFLLPRQQQTIQLLLERTI